MDPFLLPYTQGYHPLMCYKRYPFGTTYCKSKKVSVPARPTSLFMGIKGVPEMIPISEGYVVSYVQSIGALYWYPFGSIYITPMLAYVPLSGIYYLRRSGYRVPNMGYHLPRIQGTCVPLVSGLPRGDGFGVPQTLPLIITHARAWQGLPRLMCNLTRYICAHYDLETEPTSLILEHIWEIP